MPLPKPLEYNNKPDMEASLKNGWDKNDASQVRDKEVNGNGNTNVQNGIVQYSDVARAKGQTLSF